MDKTRGKTEKLPGKLKESSHKCEQSVAGGQRAIKARAFLRGRERDAPREPCCAAASPMTLNAMVLLRRGRGHGLIIRLTPSAWVA